MNIIIWDRNIILKKNDVIYEKISNFEEDEEDLRRFILIDPDKIKSLITSIDHLISKEDNTDNTFIS